MTNNEKQIITQAQLNQLLADFFKIGGVFEEFLTIWVQTFIDPDLNSENALTIGQYEFVAQVLTIFNNIKS